MLVVSGYYRDEVIIGTAESINGHFLSQSAGQLSFTFGSVKRQRSQFCLLLIRPQKINFLYRIKQPRLIKEILATIILLNHPRRAGGLTANTPPFMILLRNIQTLPETPRKHPVIIKSRVDLRFLPEVKKDVD